MTTPRKMELRSTQAPPSDPGPLLELQVVARVARTGSFTAVARELHLQVSSVTRAVGRVERRLGVRLFSRSARGPTPTDAGLAYAEHAARCLAADEALRSRFAAEREQGRTTLRVSVPVFVAERILPAVQQRFARAAPGARLEVHASDDLRDLLRDAFDLAIRQGPLRDSNLRTQLLVRFGRVVCASPGFLAAHPTLRRPEQLASVPCLLYANRPGPVTWRLRSRGGAVVDVPVDGPVRSNNLELLLALAEAGAGVARLAVWAAGPALRAGRLVALFPRHSHERDHELPSLHLVHTGDPARQRVRQAFVSALQEVIAAGPVGRTGRTERAGAARPRRVRSARPFAGVPPAAE